jgi:FtsP/CotA-like multicopper oxidase with cupredoxin domain
MPLSEKRLQLEASSALSRRELLRHAAASAWAATLAPGIVVLSGCARPANDAAAPSGETTDNKGSDADYVLRAGRRQSAPDGRKREIFCYNGQLPGLAIRAKVGQTLRVKVVNGLDVPTSVHWHGMHQPDTWQMDGVTGVSRAPIPPGSSFTYKFKATPAGTHWYHSHTGVQYGDGLFGPLIVEEETPPIAYDREEILLINDWFVESSEAILAGLLKSSEKSSGARMAGMKMASESPGQKSVGEKDMAVKNLPASSGESASRPDIKRSPPGMQMADIGDVSFQSGLFNGRGRFGDNPAAPLTAIDVNPGETLRLRLINGSSTYAFRFQIDGHRMTIIASDGAPLAPVDVDNLTINVGERYDVLLRSGGSGVSWIRAVTLDGKESLAVLRYPGAPQGEPAATPVTWGERMLAADEMRSPAPVSLAPNPREIPLRLGGTMTPYAWDINGQFFPKADTIALSADEAVRFIMENPTGMDHPFHLHGHYFYVLGKPDALNLVDPPQKDTVNVPAGTTLVLQWQATNPGRWFFHCHIEWHVETGMARIIEIAGR